jgi:hypothetical protein
MKLNEVAQPPITIEQHAAIEKWLRFHKIKKWTIKDNGVVDVNDKVNILHMLEHELPVQFGTVMGSFDIFNTGLSTLKGCPKFVGGYFDCGNTMISSFEHAPLQTRNFMCNNVPITSFSGIHRVLKQVNGYFECMDEDSSRPPTHILGLLLIPGIQEIYFDSPIVSTIMTRHAKTKNVLMAQEELIQAGFAEQARL